jgi:excisionase family DNA binding protein
MSVDPIRELPKPEHLTSPDAEATVLIPINEVARQLGVEVRHVRRLVYEARIPYIKWGHLLRFDPKEIQEWVDQYRHRPRRGA